MLGAGCQHLSCRRVRGEENRLQVGGRHSHLGCFLFPKVSCSYIVWGASGGWGQDVMVCEGKAHIAYLVTILYPTLNTIMHT